MMKKIISISLLLFALVFTLLSAKVNAENISKRTIMAESWDKIHSHINTLIDYEMVIYYHINKSNEEAKEKCENYDANKETFEHGLFYKEQIIKALKSFRESLEEIAIISNLKKGVFNEMLFLMSIHHLKSTNPLWTALEERGDYYERESEHRLELATSIYDIIDNGCK
ncbi:MAG: hypothetical protein NUV64_03405 [Parcubacteria group bacterium]|nr:hypothetical protein [Parcubacteria group bacterium]MCR4342373.1 hypothetical protein [Patescibacteria group bacterium]